MSLIVPRSLSNNIMALLYSLSELNFLFEIVMLMWDTDYEMSLINVKLFLFALKLYGVLINQSFELA